jgi:hypothetical protein
MHPIRLSLATLALVSVLSALPALQGCSRPPAQPASAATADAPTPAAQPSATASPLACALVTPAEMSTILGSAVSAEPNDRSNGKTECIYKPEEGVSPYVELAVEWGSGEGAMMGVGMAAQAEPGLASPYEGLGDQAVAIGPVLMIRTGEDLVTIVFSGVEDTPEKAKRIFDTAKARM